LLDAVKQHPAYGLWCSNGWNPGINYLGHISICLKLPVDFQAEHIFSDGSLFQPFYLYDYWRHEYHLLREIFEDCWVIILYTIWWVSDLFYYICVFSITIYYIIYDILCIIWYVLYIMIYHIISYIMYYIIYILQYILLCNICYMSQYIIIYIKLYITIY